MSHGIQRTNASAPPSQRATPIGLRSDLELVAELGSGLVTVAGCLAAGIPVRTVARLEEKGVLVRLAKGTYCDSEKYLRSTPWKQFELRTRAFVASLTVEAAACDHSALVFHDLPRLSAPPAVPHVLRDGSAHVGRTRTVNGTMRKGWCPPAYREEVKGVMCTDLAYTAVDIARLSGRRYGLIVADAALHAGVAIERLVHVAENLSLYKGVTGARWVIEHADARSESPLESAGRFILLSAKLPAAVSNPWITGGSKPWRADLLLPEYGIILEADGAVKYRNRADADLVVRAEKEREYELRQMGYEVIRFDRDLAYHRPAELVERIRKAIESRRGRPVPTNWQLTAPW